MVTPNSAPIVTSSMLDGWPQTITYNGNGTINNIVVVVTNLDGSYVTYTQTYTYPDATHLQISKWVGVRTPAP